MRLKVKPEGRKDVYLIEKEDIIPWIKQYKDDQIHHFSPGGSMMIGCDLDKEEVIEYIENSEKVAILINGAQSRNASHALAVITYNKLNIFDIGKIKESDLEITDENS